ncbi:MAG TPA: glycoside hydrolase family 57 protein [Elusimicrobiota bacterium]|nr:glycoside hydrolase family 57 protein [Elusimicrobiota bacterium]
MSSNEPILSLLFLWHQHQPFYKDPLSNRYELPWVRLHATKDYYDMVALLEEFPKIQANFNLVPSLLAQLDDYAQGKAEDKFFQLSQKPAEDLSFEDKAFLLQNFFMANWERMIDPHPRYRELLDRRGRHPSQEQLTRAQNYFKEQDWRDLQIWFNLAWFDPWWREREPFLRDMIAKGRGFSEDDKTRLLTKQLEICGLVAAKHRQMMEKGRIEITATPFYHPILPLLYDTHAAKMAMPNVNLPQRRFSHPEDARRQIEKALADHETRFGKRPSGMWPSEGSVSEEVAGLFSEAGVRWIATDEAILARSKDAFERSDIYEPYRFGADDRPIHLFFRDHELSDAIGFVYQSWDPKDAVSHFLQRLQSIRLQLKTKDGSHPRKHVVPIILDGENCWEYYHEDGLPFLRELYRRLSEEPWIETVRASDYLDRVGGDVQPLKRLWSGSWINGDFGIWIGHPEDNQAWDFVSQARDFLVEQTQQRPDLPQRDVQLAWEEIYMAEGSDWCWWYGDDHSSGNDDMFDYLFRKHVMNVYSLLGAKIPEELHLAIKKPRAKNTINPPVDFITPKIDGRITSYFEWQGAGFYNSEAETGGAMHRVQHLLKSLYFGFDLTHLYFRVDFSTPQTSESLKDFEFQLNFLKPRRMEITGRVLPDGSFPINLRADKTDSSESLPPGKFLKILEWSVPLSVLATTGKPIECLLLIKNQGAEQERWPSEAAITLPYPNPDVFAERWVI